MRLTFGLIAGLGSFGVVACESISEPGELRDGVYCLNADLDAQFAVLAFRMYGDATLDCRGYKIKDVTGSASYAVLAQGGDNIVVKNCVFDGFHTTLQFSDTTNYRIVDNVFLNARQMAINVSQGEQGLIARNVIRSPLLQEGAWQAVQDIGGLSDIVDNTIILGRNPLGWAGTPRSAISTSGGLVARNLIMNLPGPDEGGRIISTSGSMSIVYRNVLVTTPGSVSVGIVCSESPYNPVKIYYQNVFLGFLAYPNTDGNCPGGYQTVIKPPFLR